MDILNDTVFCPQFSQTDEGRALFEAIEDKKIELVSDLIEKVSNLDEINDDGDTLLHMAIHSQFIEAVERLVEKGANPDITNAQSDTAWQSACWNGYLDAVKFFVKRNKNQLYAVNCSGDTGLHLAANNGHTEVVEFLVQEDKKLLDMVNRQGNIALHLACRNGHFETVRFMVPQDKKQLNKVNLLEDTVLHAAVECKARESIKIVYFLIQQGAKLDVKNYCGITPLQQAYRKGRRGIMYCILSCMSDDEMHEIVDLLGTKYLELIISHFKKELFYENELNNVLGRFQSLNIYTPSFSNQEKQQNNTDEYNQRPLNNSNSSIQDKKQPNNRK